MKTQKQKFFTKLIAASFTTCILLLITNSINAQWTNSGGVTSHDHTSNDVLISGTSMSGAGTKVFFDHSKGAFRIGELSNNSTQNWKWNDSVVGSLSVAMGKNTLASGSAAMALGNSTKATGNFGAMAFGYNSAATGDFGATASGRSTEASGLNGATAFGNSSTASGDNGATALGYYSEATGNDGATAIGERAEATGDYGATALGYYSEATGDNGATALGYHSEAIGDEGSTAMGNRTEASGYRGATALGFYSLASGNEGATALGSRTEASGSSGATALGLYTDATGNSGATALGHGTLASGNNGATALGYRTEGTGNFGAISIGSYATADSTTSITIGSGISTSVKLENNIPKSLMIGFNSTIPTLFVGESSGAGTTGNVGIATTTPQQALDVNGAINIGNTTLNTAGALRYNAGVFEGYDGSNWMDLSGGNSSSVWQLNATNAYYNIGNVGIGLSNPQKELHIHDASGGSSNLKFTNSFTGFTNSDGFELGIGISGTNNRARVWNKEYTHMVFATNNAERMRIHKDGNVGINELNPTAELHVAGDIAVAGSIVHPSDKNLKENIAELKNGLSTINQLSPKSYTYKTNKVSEFGLSTNQQFGLIAQEVKEVLPEIVIEKALISEDGTTYMGLDYEKLIPLLIQGMKEQQEVIVSLQNNNYTQAIKNTKMQAALTLLEARLVILEETNNVKTEK